MRATSFDRRDLLRLTGALGAAAALPAASARPAHAARTAQTAQVNAAADPLTWAPPPLSNPTTITLGTGSTTNTLDPAKDYIVKLPSAAIKNGTTHLRGGRNVVVIGGHITLPSYGTAGNANAFRIQDSVGTVHIEGVYVDTVADGQGDALAIDADNAIVQVQNCRFAGLKGATGEWHADVIQPWGGVKELRVDKLTGTSNYQGLFLAVNLGPIGRATFKRTNLRMLPEWYAGAGGGYAIWIGNEEPYFSFENVYVEPRANRTLGNSVWPNASDPDHPLVITNGLGTWPSLPRTTGGVHSGPPPGGDYVPVGVAGYGYVSPGYQS